MKKKCLQLALQHKIWTYAQWSKVLFSDEYTVQQYSARKRNVRRLPGTRYNEKYTQETVKHRPSVMVWGAISIKGTAGLFFFETRNHDEWPKILKLNEGEATCTTAHVGARLYNLYARWSPMPSFKECNRLFRANKITLLDSQEDKYRIYSQEDKYS